MQNGCADVDNCTSRFLNCIRLRFMAFEHVLNVESPSKFEYVLDLKMFKIQSAGLNFQYFTSCFVRKWKMGGNKKQYLPKFNVIGT